SRWQRETGQAPSLQLGCQGLLRRCYWQDERLLWNDDPSEEVGYDAGANSGCKCDEKPQDTHERYVEIQMVGQTGADASDFLVRARAHQLLWRGRNPHHVATVGAKAPVISDGFAASVAVHGCIS